MFTRRPPLKAIAALLLAAWALAASPAQAANDPLLEEAIALPAQVLYFGSGAPGVVMGVTHQGRRAVVGFGETAKGSGREPDGDTLMRVGSISKVFTGTALASLAADGTVKLSDPLAKHLKWNVKLPLRDNRELRLIDLATHTSGLPREVPREPGPSDDPFRTLTEQAYAQSLAGNPLLFTPGSGGLYSNFAFDMLAVALGHAAGKPYEQVLRERVLAPAGLNDTVLTLRPGDEKRLMQGHFFDGSPLPVVHTGSVMAGASGLYSTPNDILKWLEWHMNTQSAQDRETRLVNHSAYVFRHDLKRALGFDESGHMDAMGLGWVIMQGDQGEPTILQKAGGLQGMFVYCAFSPSRGIGAFVAINRFNFDASMAMARTVNELINTMTQR